MPQDPLINYSKPLFSRPTVQQRLTPIIVAIAWRMEYSRSTALLNLLPDSRLR
jgi:hypothetical protein